MQPRDFRDKVDLSLTFLKGLYKKRHELEKKSTSKEEKVRRKAASADDKKTTVTVTLLDGTSTAEMNKNELNKAFNDTQRDFSKLLNVNYKLAFTKKQHVSKTDKTQTAPMGFETLIFLTPTGRKFFTQLVKKYFPNEASNLKFLTDPDYPTSSTVLRDLLNSYSKVANGGKGAWTLAKSNKSGKPNGAVLGSDKIMRTVLKDIWPVITSNSEKTREDAIRKAELSGDDDELKRARARHISTVDDFKMTTYSSIVAQLTDKSNPLVEKLNLTLTTKNKATKEVTVGDKPVSSSVYYRVRGSNTSKQTPDYKAAVDAAVEAGGDRFRFEWREQIDMQQRNTKALLREVSQ